MEFILVREFVLSDQKTRVRSVVRLSGSGESSHYIMGEVTCVGSLITMCRNVLYVSDDDY